MKTQRWIMHIDMDAFYASIEQLDNPELQGKALIIGGEKRGVVSTASYEARKFGVHSAMPISEARRLCPHGVYIRPRMARYVECSHIVRETLRDFSPLVEMASVDEAYLEATGMERVFGPVPDMARALKDAVRRNTGGLTCSVGVAPIKFMAKIASEQRKPDGIFIIRPEDMPSFLAELEIRAVPGVGKKFAAALAKVGVRRAGDVLRYPAEYWERRFGKAGTILHQRASGIDTREVVPFTPPKSESAETTFETDTLDMAFLQGWLLRHAERVGRSLRKQNLAGRTVTLKIKYKDFKQITRQMSLPDRTNSTETVYRAGLELLEGLELENKVRLIGLGVSGFDETRPYQLSLMEPQGLLKDDPRRTSLETALDALRDKYGQTAVVRGKLFEEKPDQAGGDNPNPRKYAPSGKEDS